MVTIRSTDFCFTARHADSFRQGGMEGRRGWSRKRSRFSKFFRVISQAPMARTTSSQYLGYFVFTGTARPGIVMLYTCPAWKSSSSSIPPSPSPSISSNFNRFVALDIRESNWKENNIVGRSFGKLETMDPRSIVVIKKKMCCRNLQRQEKHATR